MRDWMFGTIIGLVVVLTIGDPGPASALPPGFSRVLVTLGLDQPTGFVFKGSKILVTEKASGKVRVVNPDGSLRPTPYVTVSVSTERERGLLGIAIDPNFATNKFVYLYYTTGPGALGYTGLPTNRVSRFTTVLGSGTNETVILDHIPSDNGIHNGGDLLFGADGTLYVSVGDGGVFVSHPQAVDTLRGKILRVRPDGKIPVDNPYKFDPAGRKCGKPGPPPPEGSGPCKEVYAFGLRNPFRLSLRASNSSVLIGDVGFRTWEELNTLVANANYGWSDFEGPCPRLPDANCVPDTTPYPSEFTYPIHFYNQAGIGETGQTIIAGAFAQNGGNYPAPYAGAYFYGDFSADWIHVLTMNGANGVTGQFDFADVSTPVAFRTGADGNIYVLSFGKGKIFKYVYTP